MMLRTLTDDELLQHIETLDLPSQGRDELLQLVEALHQRLDAAIPKCEGSGNVW